jgi:hypothetical protein
MGACESCDCSDIVKLRKEDIENETMPIVYRRTFLTKKSAAIVVATFGVFIRLIALMSYEPYVESDFGGYQQTAQFLLSGNALHYDGVRPPGYPLLLLVCGMDFHIIWIVQCVLGVAVALMLFDIASLMTHRHTMPLILGLSYSVSINMLFFEATIMSEAWSTFIIVLLMWVAIRISRDPNKGSIAKFAFAGLLAGFAALTRPLFLFLTPLLFLYFLWRLAGGQGGSSLKMKAIVSFALPALILIVGWSVVNSITVDYFGVTTLTGFNLTNHSGGFMELAPEEYASVRDIYLDHRKREIEQNGTHSMTIWRAIPEMKAKTGLSYSDLSSKMTKLSIRLFAEHPLLYLASVSKAWVNFWKVTVYWIPEEVKYMDLRKVIAIVWQPERYILLLANILFLAGSARQAYCLVYRKAAAQPEVLLMGSVVLIASILQALMEYGENARYSIPFQPLVMLMVFTMLSGMLTLDRTKSGENVIGRR